VYQTKFVILFCHSSALFWEIREHTKSVFESHIWKDERKYNGRILISTTRVSPSLNSLNTKKTTTYDVENPGSGLEQALHVAGIHQLMGINTKSVFESHIWKDERKYNGRMTDNKMEGWQTMSRSLSYSSLITDLQLDYHDGCRYCLPFRNTRVHPHIL
jgi:hypothetical protein